MGKPGGFSGWTEDTDVVFLRYGTAERRLIPSFKADGYTWRRNVAITVALALATVFASAMTWTVMAVREQALAAAAQDVRLVAIEEQHVAIAAHLHQLETQLIGELQKADKDFASQIDSLDKLIKLERARTDALYGVTPLQAMRDNARAMRGSR